MGHVTELHLHLDGSLRPETVWELAKEQGIRLPAESAEEVKMCIRDRVREGTVDGQIPQVE